MDYLTYKRYTLVMQVEHKGEPIELGSVSAQLPAELESRPADLFDAFAAMLRAGADRMPDKRMLSSSFCSSRNGPPAAVTTHR
jgi:hypothetical protein